MTDDLPNIWVMQTERDVAGLTTALRHTDARIRRRAAAALRVIGARAAAPALVDALKLEQDPEARMAIAAALEYLQPEAKPKPETADEEPTKRRQTRIERLIQHLTGPRPHLAIQAAQALAEMDNRAAVPALVTVFRSPRRPPAVRLAAAEALLAMNSAPAEVTLLAALSSEKWHLRRNGAAILGRLGAEWAVEPLARALYDPHELVARTARAALRRIGTPEAMQALNDAKHAMIDTSEAIDPEVVRKAKRIKQEKVGKQVTSPLDPEKVDQYVEKQPKVDTSQLKPPAKKPETGTLKQPPLPDTNSAALPNANSRPAPPEPAPPDDDERTQSRRRKSATERLSPPPDDSDTG